MVRLTDEQRAWLAELHLEAGTHAPGSGHFSDQEAAAYLAGEPHSNGPSSVSPVLSAFRQAWNDALPDDASRDRLLKPSLPRTLQTRGTAEQERQRSYWALDWLARTYLPAWLRLVPPLGTYAAALAARHRLKDWESERAAAAAWLAAQEAALYLAALVSSDHTDSPLWEFSRPPAIGLSDASRLDLLAAMGSWEEAVVNTTPEGAPRAWGRQPAGRLSDTSRALWQAAGNAAEAAANDAVRWAAGDAAVVAAQAALGDATPREKTGLLAPGAVQEVAQAAAWVAARRAAWPAVAAEATAREAAAVAADAARVALRSTVARLEVSACDLMELMIARTGIMGDAERGETS